MDRKKDFPIKELESLQERVYSLVAIKQLNTSLSFLKNLQIGQEIYFFEITFWHF